MFRILVSAIAASTLSLPASADIDPDAMASCMQQNTTPEIKEGMKQFMIHALQSNKEAATQELLKFSFSSLSIATVQCGLTFGDVQTPAFEAGMEKYGEALGLEIMTEALNFLEIPTD